MNNIAVLFAGHLTPYAHMPLAGGASAFERALEKASGLPAVTKTVVFTRDDLPKSGAFEVLARPEWNRKVFFEELTACSAGCDNIFFFHADCPLLDTGLTEKMFRDHTEYFAGYTFADGYPYGLTPEILKTKILCSLLRLAGDSTEAVGRDTIFQVLQRDINTFDIETRISPRDLRMLRVDIACDTMRNFLLVQRIMENGGHDEASILSVLQEKPELLRTLPAYVSVQVTDRYPQRVAYLPEGFYPAAEGTGGREMTPEQFSGIMARVAGFAGDAVVCLSFRGDPSMYSAPEALVETALAYPGIRLLIETSGIAWNKGVLEHLISLAGSRITWIVELDARDQSLYRRLRGDGWEEAYRTADFLVSEVPESAYVQAVRMKENEEDLEQFYRYWKEKTEHVIIKKYDFFHGLLQQKRVTDLSPLKRFPCWHLKRDLYVLVDGRVPRCCEDIAVDYVMGNILSDGLEYIWNGGFGAYEAHLSGNYSGICTECDEYYTFNF